MCRSVGEFRKTCHPRNVEVNEVLKMCFSGAKHSRFSGILNPRSLGIANTAIFRNLEPAKPRGRERAIFRKLEPVKPRNREHAKVWNLEPAKSRTLGDGKFKNLSEVWFGSHGQENSRTSEKQSQSCRPKKSRFRV
jgi:hypothetical protein